MKFKKGDNVYWVGWRGIKHCEKVLKTKSGKVYFVDGGYCYESDLFQDITPVKRKPRLVRVKAWYSEYYEDLTLQRDVIIGKKPHKCFKPCFILIDKKHLKGK